MHHVIACVMVRSHYSDVKKGRTSMNITPNTEVGLTLTQLHELSVSTIYLMGFSFILGSAFTVLLLLLLDFMRMRRGVTDTQQD